MRRTILLTLLLILPLNYGCRGPVHELDEQYRPLERVQESVLRPGTAITTIGRTAYVNDLEKWLVDRPVGSPRYHAILLHERLHAQRQLDYGLTSWLARYLRDVDFMRDEELRGWYIQLTEYRRRGLQISPEGVAKTLSNYRNLVGRMMSYEDALTWVRDVLAGRWRPED